MGKRQKQLRMCHFILVIHKDTREVNHTLGRFILRSAVAVTMDCQ